MVVNCLDANFWLQSLEFIHANIPSLNCQFSRVLNSLRDQDISVEKSPPPDCIVECFFVIPPATNKIRNPVVPLCSLTPTENYSLLLSCHVQPVKLSIRLLLLPSSTNSCRPTSYCVPFNYFADGFFKGIPVVVKTGSVPLPFAVRIGITYVVVRRFILLKEMSHLRRESMSRYDIRVKTYVEIRAKKLFFVL